MKINNDNLKELQKLADEMRGITFSNITNYKLIWRYGAIQDTLKDPKTINSIDIDLFIVETRDLLNNNNHTLIA